MRTYTRALAIPIAAALMLLVACGDEGSDTSQAATTETRRSTSVQVELPTGDQPVDLDPAGFTADIDNEYWPMQPGTRWVSQEVDEDGNELQVVVTVSTETKEIANGVTARIVRDTVSQDGEVIEDTFDWYAQDSDGSLWYLGEDTAEFENGEISTTEGSFEAGVDGALPGIIMPANPAVGAKYRQEYYEGEAEDNGEILSVDEQAEVPFGHFDSVVLTKDTITIEPDVLEYKLYAPGVGPVLVFGVSGGGGSERLVDVTTISDEMARAAGTTPLGERYG
jgi:hypothetical protein